MRDLSILDRMLIRAAFPITRICRTCKRTKLITEFSRRGPRHKGHVLDCKSCINKKKRIEHYLKRHPGRITESEAEKLAENRWGTCEVCLKAANLYVDHCHETGKRRGTICLRCNLFLGQVHDDVQLLYRAIRYLEIDRG